MVVIVLTVRCEQIDKAERKDKWIVKAEEVADRHG